MGLREWADRLAGAEPRSTSFQAVWGSGGTWDTAVGASTVTIEASLGLPALYAAVDLIAGQIAAMPLQTFRKQGDERERATDGPLVTNPSDLWAPDEWVYVACASMLLFGEAIGVTTRVGTNGWPSALEWIDPRRVTIERIADGSLRYTADGELLPPQNVTHVRHGLLLPGTLRGVSPIRRIPNSISVGLEALVYERDWFAGGAHPSGVLSVDVPSLTEEQADEIVTRFVRKTKARRPVALSKVAHYQTIQADPSGSGLDMAKRRIANDVANVFHVSPELVGGNTGESLTYQNLETQQLLLDLRALMPVYTRLERALSQLMPRPTYVRFNADSSFRADAKTRAEIAEIQLRSGQRTIDEVRAKDELPPITEAPGYIPPAPTVPAGA